MKDQVIISREVARAIAALNKSDRWEATAYALHYGFGDVPVSDNPLYDPITRGIDKANKYVMRATAEDIDAIIAHLNEKRGAAYKATTPSTRKLINARYGEGFTKEDFFLVIDHMVSEWSGTRFDRYIRPQTLFAPKFESYLNDAKVKAESGSFDLKAFYEAAHEKVYGGEI